jgi:type II secretion system protein G
MIKRHKSKKQNVGFTLIEMLVVISIISLLSSIIIASMRNVQQKALIVTLQRDARVIYNQIDLFRQEHNKTVTGLTGSLCSSCIADDYSELNKVWVKLGFSSSPLDPWGRPFIIQEKEEFLGPGDCMEHDQVYSTGKDGEFQSFLAKSPAPPGQVTTANGDDYIFSIGFLRC